MMLILIQLCEKIECGIVYMFISTVVGWILLLIIVVVVIIAMSVNASAGRIVGAGGMISTDLTFTGNLRAEGNTVLTGDNDMEKMRNVPGSRYLGTRYENGKRYYVWNVNPERASAEANTNPPMVVESHGGFNVINDAKLLAGTKQRGLVPLLRDMPQKEFIYVGPYTGFAQVALALAAKVNGKIATLFTQKHRPMSYQTKLALELGAQVYEFTPPYSSLHAMRERAEEYIHSSADPQSVYMFPLGFNDEGFKTNLLKSLREVSPLDADFAGTVWVAGGSALLANILYELFPKARINVVQIGKDIDWHIKPERSTLYIAPERFYEPATVRSPYTSVPEYDEKVWRFVKEHGAPGDYIWNVASAPESPLVSDVQQKGKRYVKKRVIRK
jgi:hypothetical protein